MCADVCVRFCVCVLVLQLFPAYTTQHDRHTFRRVIKAVRVSKRAYSNSMLMMYNNYVIGVVIIRLC